VLEGKEKSRPAPEKGEERIGRKRRKRKTRKKEN
jgi:hypothetical protein